MPEMIVLKCDTGSKAATVLCPECGRISRQILKRPFVDSANNELLTTHICPVCGAAYKTCNSFGADAWRAAYSGYLLNPDTYNASVKENQLEKVLAKSLKEQQTPYGREQQPAGRQAPFDGQQNIFTRPQTPLTGQQTQTSGQQNAEAISKQQNPSSNLPDLNPNASGSSNPLDSQVERKIEHWKRELLDTGKRNRMINYRETKRTTLKILEPGPAELFNQLALNEKTLTFQRPISRDSDFRTYSVLSLLETLSYSLPAHVGDIKAEGTVMEREKTLKNLRTKTRLAQEEQGTNILYLSFGFILWREHNRDSSPWMKSPLLLMPVQLGLKSLNAPFTLSKHDDEIEVNPTLDYLFNQNYGIDLPTFELKNRDSFENYLETIEEIVDRRGWKLVREVNLGLLSFLKISMYHDLDENRDRMLNHPVIRAISGDREALPDLPQEANHFNFDKTQPSEWYEVVDSDSSQEEAILLSKLGVSFVMQGPPGTGKSQTITNIIAEALGDGKKVLFVSEKSAALQVVLKRLTEARLDDFCLSLHDYKANKKEIIDNIGANLDLEPEYVETSAGSEFAELYHDREFLDQYANELHEPIQPLGESAYSVFGKLEKLNDAADIHFKFDTPADVSKEQYQSLLYVVSAFERALHNLDGKLSDNPWKDTSAASAGQTFKAQMLRETEGLPNRLDEMEAIVKSFNDDYGTSFSPQWTYIHNKIREIDAVLALPLFPIEWRDSGRRKFLRERALVEEKIDEAEQGQAGQLAGAMRDINECWNTDLLDFSLHDLAHVITGETNGDQKESTELLATRNAASIDALTAVETELKDILVNYNSAKTLLRIETDDQPASILMAAHVLAILSDAPEMERAWFDVRKTEEYQAAVREIRAHQDLVRMKTGELLQDWDSKLLDLDVDGMLSRFKTEYTGMFHKLKGTYKDDIRQIKVLSRSVGIQIEESEIIDLLQKVQSLNEEKKWFAVHEEHLKGLFAAHYHGIDTDCDRISAGIEAACRIAEEFPYASIPADVIDAIMDIESSIQMAAEVRRLADLLKEEPIKESFKTLSGEGMNSGSLSEDLLPETRKRIEEGEQNKAFIARIDAAKKNGSASFADVKRLMENAEGIRKECLWFKENIPDIGPELKIGDISGEETIRTQISQAGLILKNHDAIAERDETEELTALFGNRYTGNFTDWQGVIRDIDAVEAFEDVDVSADIAPFIQSVCDNGKKREEAGSKEERLKRLFEEAEPKLTYFEKLFPQMAMRDLLFHEVSAKYEACMNRFGDLNKWLDYVETKADCDKAGLSDFTDKIAKNDNEITDVRRAFERGFYTQWLNLAVSSIPSVQTFRRRVQEQRLERFISLDERQFELSKERIRERIIRTFPDRNMVYGAKSEIRILQHEMEKKRRIMPLRKLFHEIPNLLLTLKPCLMMSPLSVAYFLNAEDYHFDMVIFDEASQIFPQDAIGAIFRANQAIIAGDTKQLPPTNFFSTSTSNDADYDEDDDDYEDETYDSILEETANVLPNRTLLWHYRSRHEHLIAFSNQEIYRNELVTFPSSKENEPDTGVEFEFVEDGYYESNGKNCNLPEARRCVQLVQEHIDKHPDRSLGIIAFSEKQQQAIALEIQRFREQNPEYESFFTEDREDEFFVKNLENVQGDERDTIFFSVGYAKTKAQKAAGKPMAIRFGPLGVSGGERRLNVAITRAKTNVKLISSILSSDIDLNRTNSDGIRMLRSYLEFAKNGGAALGTSNRGRRQDEFADVIYKYICDKGYKAKQYVGCSGYRIDIAVVNPENENEFAAGIECDGNTYVSARTARDRDRLRGAVLKNMGWHMYRVWSTEWYRNPEIEGQKLIDYIDWAIKKVNEQWYAYLKAQEEEQERIREEEEQARLEEEREEIRRQQEEQRRAEEERRKAELAKERRRQAAEARKKAEEQAAERRRIAEERAAESRKRAEEREAERKRKEEEERRAAAEKKKEKRLEQQQLIAEQRKRQEEEIRELSWVKIDDHVLHRFFGEGRVVGLDYGKVKVQFEGEQLTFVAPGSFISGLLRNPDGSKITRPEKPKEPKEPETRDDSKQLDQDDVLNGILGSGGPSGETDAAEKRRKPSPVEPKTGNGIYETFKINGFNCFDNRSASGILWVLYEPDKTEMFKKIAARYRVPYSLEKRGVLATSGRAAWMVRASGREQSLR